MRTRSTDLHSKFQVSKVYKIKHSFRNKQKVITVVGRRKEGMFIIAQKRWESSVNSDNINTDIEDEIIE